MMEKDGQGEKSSPTAGWAVALTLILAAGLRLARLDLMEFKGDEAAAAALVVESLSGPTVPTHGLMSSVGVYNPPIFIDLLLVPGLLSLDPLHLAQFIALLNVAAVFLCYEFGRRFFNPRVGLVSAILFAAAPWAVIYSRKIWAQDCLPFFSLVVIGGIHEVCGRGNRRWFFPAAVSAGLMPGIHFSGFFALAVFGLAIAVCRPKVGWKAWVSVAAFLSVAYAPYLAAPRNESRLGEAFSLSRFSPSPLAEAARITTPLGMDYLLGPAAAGRFEQEMPPLLRPGVRAAAAAVLLLSALGLGRLALWAVAQFRPGVRQALAGFRAQPGWTLCALWMGLPLCGYLLLSTDRPIYPHYLILLYPVPFWLAADTADRLAGFVGGAAWSRAGAGLVLAAAALVQALFVARLLDFLAREGGAPGDYGVCYRHKVAAAEFVAASAAASGVTPILASPTRPDLREYEALVSWRLQAGDRPPGPAAGPTAEFWILEWDAAGPDGDGQTARLGPVTVAVRAAREGTASEGAP